MVQNTQRSLGAWRILVVIYGILALAATGRSVVQILTKFDEAPVAYVLSALSAVVYIVATVALVARGSGWYRVALYTISFELLGVLVVGLLSLFDPVLFPDDTVWSYFGAGYIFIPLVLPILGLYWLRRRARAANVGATASAESLDAGSVTSDGPSLDGPAAAASRH